MPSVPRVLGGLVYCLPWAYGTSGVRPHNGVGRSGKALRRLAFGARAGRRSGVLPQSAWIRVKEIGRFWVGLPSYGFPGAAFSAWRERFAAGVPFWKNGLVLSHVPVTGRSRSSKQGRRNPFSPEIKIGRKAGLF
jgi:hypothetical protein